MNAALLLKHFDRLAEAPNAVPRLRRFILDLAVRGKLVEQDPNDEPASELLKRIEAEKARLVKNGEIRKGRQRRCREVSLDFRDMPAHWELPKLENLSRKITDGAHKTPNYIAKGVPFISVKDFSSGMLSFSACRHISQEEHDMNRPGFAGGSNF
jgi:type I restriction enzyme S subunit